MMCAAEIERQSGRCTCIWNRVNGVPLRITHPCCRVHGWMEPLKLADVLCKPKEAKA